MSTCTLLAFGSMHGRTAFCGRLVGTIPWLAYSRPLAASRTSATLHLRYIVFVMLFHVHRVCLCLCIGIMYLVTIYVLDSAGRLSVVQAVHVFVHVYSLLYTCLLHDQVTAYVCSENNTRSDPTVHIYTHIHAHTRTYMNLWLCPRLWISLCSFLGFGLGRSAARAPHETPIHVCQVHVNTLFRC
uniref:Uncharacterized protein n=1 Tax=Rhipicephalus pulchellus TaxID=72859 RepID=L7LWC8_RHIPC